MSDISLAKSTLSLKMVIGLDIASTAIFSVLLTLSASGYNNTTPKLKSSTPSIYGTIIIPRSCPISLLTHLIQRYSSRPACQAPYGAPSQASKVLALIATSLPSAIPTDLLST